jgi:hypothetical protein
MLLEKKPQKALGLTRNAEGAIFLCLDDFEQVRMEDKAIFHSSIFGHLDRQIVHHIQLKIHFGRSPSSHKNKFCKKLIDDPIVQL